MTADQAQPGGTPQVKSQGRTQDRVAAGLLVLGGALLVAMWEVSLWAADQSDYIEPWAAWLTLAFAGLAAAAAEAALSTRRRAGPLAAGATLGALISDQLPTGAPNHLVVLPLAAATIILLVRAAESSPVGGELGPGQRVARILVAVVGWVGVALQLVVGVLYLAGSAIIMPTPWVLAFGLLWVALFGIAVRVRARHPAWTPIVPVASFALWWAAIVVGSPHLGWSG